MYVSFLPNKQSLLTAIKKNDKLKLSENEVFTTEVLRALYFEGGPRTSLTAGGWVSANKTSSGRKSLCRDVGRGLDLSMVKSLLLSTGSFSKSKNNVLYTTIISVVKGPKSVCTS